LGSLHEAPPVSDMARGCSQLTTAAQAVPFRSASACIAVQHRAPYFRETTDYGV